MREDCWSDGGVLMNNSVRGPIEEVSFGKFVVLGVEHSTEGSQKKGSGKDIRMIGEEVSEWLERRGHVLNPQMITGVYEKDVCILIIGTGHDGALEVSGETIDEIRAHGINEVIVEKTPNACKRYNEYYVKGYKIAMLAHGTC